MRTSYRNDLAKLRVLPVTDDFPAVSHRLARSVAAWHPRLLADRRPSSASLLERCDPPGPGRPHSVSGSPTARWRASLLRTNW
jgi:hypothetical protein